MAAEIHRLQTKPVATSWMCSACGIDAGCNCGAPLMSKAQRAAEAIAANPQKSDRAIAKEIGASPTTVGQARSELSSGGQLNDRVGIDGKQRRMPTRRDEDEFDDDIAVEQTKQVFLLGAHEAIRVAEYYGPIDNEIIETARDTAAAWCRLVSRLTGERS